MTTYFDATDRRRVRGLGLTLTANNPAGDDDDGEWIGDPATSSATQQIRSLVESLAIVDRIFIIWINRKNHIDLPNTRPSQLAPFAGPDNSQTLRRTRPLNWQSGFAYVVGQKVYDTVGLLSYQANVDHTSGATFAGDIANWTQITGSNATPECRCEFSTYYRAILSVIAITMYICDMPETDGGAGWGDLLTTEGMTYHEATDAETNRDTIFTAYPLDLTGTGTLDYAVTTDVVVMPVRKLTDIHTDWATNTAMSVGQVKRDTGPSPPTFWCCREDHTSAASGTFAQDRAGAALNKWRQIRVGIQPDWEPQDLRPKNSTDDPSVEKNQNTVYLLTAMSDLMRPRGYTLEMYTNDIDPLNPIPNNNGIGESNMDQILELVDILEPAIDSNNRRGNNMPANLVINCNRMRFENGDPSQPERANYDISKVGLVIEMVEEHGNRSWPITAMSVGAGPTYTVTLTAPNNIVSGMSYIDIRGSYGVPEINGTFFTAGIDRAAGTFELRKKVLSVNQMTGAVTEETFSGQGLGTYLGGGVVGNGGTTRRDAINFRRIVRKLGIREITLWRNNADQAVTTIDWPLLRISNITNANPAVVTTTTPHGLTTAAADSRVTLEAVLGMTQVNRNVFQLGTIPSTTTFQLLGYNSSALPAYAGGGIVRVTRRSGFNRKVNTLAYGRGMPRMMI